MARLGLICLVLAGFLLVSAIATDKSDTDHSASIAAEPSSDSESMEEGVVAEAPSLRRLGPAEKSEKKADKSVAGGGIIIGGLVTTIFAAVFCYIRVTRKRGGVQ
ncbi:hypothetical protein D8674_035756 [Pyrus ussuriensis x Pyrus communis]|uniref:Transmembrane protein n=1 Tax=Pyrus ussuriensis x Pyrus communis TaxID=2448454 RepID=A0A5N5GJH8_9ROSA|nr:hypothetical protein D8674_035756 [Pyrus ussuriensis x Pyrus communis]